MSDLEDDTAPETYRYISKPGKLKWKAKPKIGSLEKISHMPGGGDVILEKNRICWKKEAKIGSLDNINHKPLGGNMPIFDQKPKWEKKSRCGSLGNIHYKPGGGDVDINNVEGTMRWGKWKPLPSINISGDSMNEWVDEKPKKGSTGFFRTSNTGALEYSTQRPLSRGVDYFTKTEPNPNFDYEAYVKNMEELKIIDESDFVKSKKAEARIHKPKQYKDKQGFKVEVKKTKHNKQTTHKGVHLSPLHVSHDENSYNANVPPNHDSLGATTGYNSNFLLKRKGKRPKKTLANRNNYEHEGSPRSEAQTRNSHTPTYGSLYQSTKMNNDKSISRYNQRSPYLMESVRTQHETPKLMKPLNRPMGYVPQSVRNDSHLDTRSSVFLIR
ncbi:unnamed protein product [Owenia fusiformis]|uniref:Microtubule-associated protein n=1 Tax=Owenia fusiformis TaxID=6347 RepID=A0A8S4MW41_OWEFU|nr:unnamed protein product [Owenia fusiformis]